MKCEACETEVRFSDADELFFFTPEGKKPCEKCKAKFDKIKNWARNLETNLKLGVAFDLTDRIDKLEKMVFALSGIIEKTKKKKKRMFW